MSTKAREERKERHNREQGNVELGKNKRNEREIKNGTQIETASDEAVIQ